MKALEKRPEARDEAGTLLALINLGHCLALQSRWAEAEPVLREALDAQLAHQGPDASSTLNCWGNLAFVLYREGRFAEALEAQAAVVAHTSADSPRRAERESLLGDIRVALALPRVEGATAGK